MKKHSFILQFACGALFLLLSGEQLWSKGDRTVVGWETALVNQDGGAQAQQPELAPDNAASPYAGSVAPDTIAGTEQSRSANDDVKYPWIYGAVALVLVVIAVGMIWKRKHQHETEINIRAQNPYGQFGDFARDRRAYRQRQKEEAMHFPPQARL
jgi:predicted tellurium resistance membrane protein TerC